MKLIFKVFFIFAPILDAVAQETSNPSATILFKSKGDAKHVTFHSSVEPKPCEGLALIAGVYDAELVRRTLLGFVARTIEKTNTLAKVYPQVEVSVPAGVPMQVLGQSSSGGAVQNFVQSGRCGPFTQQFIPQSGHKYLVQFTIGEKACSQEILDVTEWGAPLPVESAPLACRQPMFK